MKERFNPAEMDLKEKVVQINRVAKTVKGGKNMRFSCLCVVGDEAGHVGVGIGKAIEVPEAIRKGMQDARKNMITVPVEGTTVPHAIVGCFGAGRVLIMPAAKGTGIIAGGAARPVFELAGIQDIRCKSIGSDNSINVVKATLTGLSQLVNVEMVAKKRGKTPEEILG